jgi:hypothetical protein
MNKEYVLKDIGIKSTFNIKPNYNIIFHRGNTQIGVLDFNGPEMTFSGDMDESAILFIEVIANSFKARLEQERAVGYREGHMAALSQRTWVGLDDEDYIKALELTDFDKDAAFEFFEAALKEKNT